jgi:hypothetical protein
MACAYLSAVSEPREKSVARRMFFKESEMAGSSVFMKGNLTAIQSTIYSTQSVASR